MTGHMTNPDEANHVIPQLHRPFRPYRPVHRSDFLIRHHPCPHRLDHPSYCCRGYSRHPFWHIFLGLLDNSVEFGDCTCTRQYQEQSPSQPISVCLLVYDWDKSSRGAAVWNIESSRLIRHVRIYRAKLSSVLYYFQVLHLCLSCTETSGKGL
jgi:hypothetical protein